MMWFYLFSGMFAGLMSGMLGLGGGIVVVPALSYIFLKNGDIPPHLVMQMAVGTSLAVMVVTLASSVYSHNRRGSVLWPEVRPLFFSLGLGVVTGTIMVRFISSAYLSRFFSVFLLVIAVRLLLEKKRPPALSGAETVPWGHKFPPFYRQGCAALIGILSSLLGVGGGTLWVPFFLAEGASIRMAVGTSVACGIVAASIATLSILCVGRAGHVPWSTGYIYWPAFLGISVMSVLFAPLGVILAHRLPQVLLKRAFALLMLLMAFDMMFI